jgi:CubicO group peptidase (beta-lactamase class C family)
MTICRKIFLPFLLLLAFDAAAAKGQPDTAALDSYENFVRQWLDEKHVPGLTLGFFKEDFVWIRSFGHSDLENRISASPDSSYRLASVQKSMTAVAVLQLAETGKLDLDADIRTYVPYFPAKAQAITARQLLSHLSGLPHYVDREVEQHIKEHKTTREAIAIFGNFELLAPPGAKFNYSSYGYNLLGAAIEGASGQRYEVYMREHVWDPAGMTNTRMDDPLEIIPNRVRGYQQVNGEVKNSEFIDVSSRFAAGGTRGTVGDLLRFMVALESGKLLSPAMLELMYTQARTTSGDAVPYALGWQIPPFTDRHSIVTNDGGQPETRTFILHDPEHQFGMALAMNLEADIYGPVVLRLYATVMGKPLVVQR